MKHTKRFRAAALWVIFFGLLFVLNPVKLPIYVLILPYIALFLALRVSWQVAEEFIREQKQEEFSSYESERSTLFAAILVGFLALASIGQLTIRDVSTVTLLAFLGYFYMTRNKSNSE